MKYITMIVLAVAVVSMGACAHNEAPVKKTTASTYSK
jgi:hypothetical protein